MPRGQYDRTKTKAQRDAEKTAGKPAKLDMRVKANKLAAKAAPKKSFKAAKKAMDDKQSDIVQTTEGVFFKTNIAINVRMETLMDYATCLANLGTSLSQAGVTKSPTTTAINEALSKCLERMELAVDEVQPLSLPVEQNEEPEAQKVAPSDIEAYIAKNETKAPSAPIVAETPPAPVVRSAPIPFNPAVPPNGS